MHSSHLFACDQCVLDAAVHPPLVLLADITIALKALDLAGKACCKVLAGEVLNVRDTALALQRRHLVGLGFPPALVYLVSTDHRRNIFDPHRRHGLAWSRLL